MPCPNESACELFPLISGSGALTIWKNYFCDGNFEGCKRYQSSLNGEKIPLSLLPNGKILDLDSHKKGAKPT